MSSVKKFACFLIPSSFSRSGNGLFPFPDVRVQRYFLLLNKRKNTLTLESWTSSFNLSQNFSGSADNLDLETFVLDENTYPTIFDVLVEPSVFDKNGQEQFKREANFDEKSLTDVGMKKIALKDSEKLDFGTKIIKNGTEKLVYKESMVSKIPSNVELDRLIIGNIAGIEKMLDL